MTIQKMSVFILCLGLSFTLGCDKEIKEEAEEAIEDATSNIVDSTIGEASSAAGAIEGSLSLQSGGEFENYSAPNYNASATCDIATIRSASCTTGTDGDGYTYGQKTIEFGGCSVGPTTVTGTITETWMGMGVFVCSMNGDAATLSRVISSTNPKVITFPTGATLTVDNEPGTAYDGTVFANASKGTVITRTHSNSNGLTCSSGADANACYTIVANGLHKTLKGPKGRVWFEHIIDTNLTVKGSKAAATRTVVGTTTVWHEVSGYKATNTFNSVQWTDSTCCYPTSGSVSTAFEGALTGTATTTFTASCGQADFVGTDGATETITLKQCQ